MDMVHTEQPSSTTVAQRPCHGATQCLKDISDTNLIFVCAEQKSPGTLGTKLIHFDYSGMISMSVHLESHKDDPDTKTV